MKPWVRDAVLWVGIAFMSSIINFLYLLWIASFPRFGDVSFATACERSNTFVNGIRVFVIVLAIGAMRVILRELKRRVFVSMPSDYNCPTVVPPPKNEESTPQTDQN